MAILNHNPIIASTPNIPRFVAVQPNTRIVPSSHSRVSNSLGRELNEAEKFVTYKGKNSYMSRRIANHRNEYLNYVNETRRDISTYKKYLLITLKGTELFKLTQGNISSLIRKNVPSWVMKEINAGKAVDGLIYVEWDSPIYFKYGEGSNKAIKLTDEMRNSNIGRDPKITKLNDSFCGKFKINNIIKAFTNKDGIYSDNIKDMAKLNKIKLDKLINFGKIKPLYSLGISDIVLFDKGLKGPILLTKFNVNEISLTDVITGDEKTEFILNIHEVLEGQGFHKMGTVWL